MLSEDTEKGCALSRALIASAMAHFVYILEAQNGNYYIGYTTNLEKRMKAHSEGKGAKFTRAFGFKKLLYSEKYRSKSKAMRREAELKKLTRKEKETLLSIRLTLSPKPTLAKLS